MNKATTNQVRQILMNELGLTRASIREMASELVAQEVAKELKGDGVRRAIEKAVQDAVSHYMREYSHDTRSLKRHVEKVCYDAITEQIKARVNVSLDLSE